MISTDFAPNEKWDDAWISFKLLFQPWRWQKGKEAEEIITELLRKFQFPISNFQTNNKYPITNNQYKAFLYLTGRSALYTILRSLRLSPNSEVVVQAFTCEAVILPILANNLKPVYVDIETKTLSINPIELERKISKQTRAVILQHSFGMTPGHRAKILTLVRKHKLLLIEDIAHGYSSEKISNFKFQIPNSIFLMSFGRSKAISSVFGGAIITNDKAIVKKLDHFERKQMPSQSFILRLLLYKPLSMIVKSTYDVGLGKLIHKMINLTKIFVPEISQKEKGGNYDLILDKAYPNALAILLLHQLDKFEQINKVRAAVCEIYRKKLKNNTFLTAGFSLIRYPILVDQPQKLLSEASRQNIFLGKWYDQVVAPKSLDLEKVGYKIGSCPIAENVCRKIINLPTLINEDDLKNLLSIIFS